jgi:TPR repeat protein
VTKTNCTQLRLTHLFKVPEQAPNMPHTDTDEDEDEDGDLTMEGMTTRSNSQTTGTRSHVGSATDMVRKPSRHNNYQQMYEDGMMHCFGLDFEPSFARDEKRGRSMIEAAALGGFPMAVACCLQRRWDQTHPEQYFNGSGSVDKATCRKRALAMYVKIEQETKYHWAQFELGHSHGTDQDYTKAVEWYTKASAQGNTCAMNSLGLKYVLGLGCIQNYTTAIKWFTKASAQGDSHAMNYLGQCYADGKGCDQDYTKALQWYTKASAQGDSDAMFNLGYCYGNGHGCDQDRTTAFKWFTKASAQGDTCAMNNLGLCWMNGWGCDQNQTTAFEWYKKSAQLGDKDAQDKLNSRMFSPNPAALGANGNEQSHTSKRRQPDSSTSTCTSDSDDDLL